jgi:hypothetical protein
MFGIADCLVEIDDRIERATTRTVLSVMGVSAGNPGNGVDKKRELVHALTQWLLFVCP